VITSEMAMEQGRQHQGAGFIGAARLPIFSSSLLIFALLTYPSWPELASQFVSMTGGISDTLRCAKLVCRNCSASCAVTHFAFP
jgi:hypothetical protein